MNNSYDVDHDQNLQPSFPSMQTQIFDKNLPSELNFENNLNQQEDQQILEGSEICKGVGFVKQTFLNKPEAQSQFSVLTKCILHLNFKKNSNQIASFLQHSKGSFIPFDFKIKTFPVQLFRKEGQSSNYFWKRIVNKILGYSDVELYIQNGFIYILSKQSNAYSVQDSWALDNLFKIFSDREDNKLRMVFRMKKGEQIVLKNEEIQCDDINLLSKIIEETNRMGIICS